MKEVGIAFIVTGAVVGAMAGILGGHIALVVGIIMIMVGQLFLGGAKIAPAVISTGLILAVVLSFSGCGASQRAVRTTMPASNPAMALLENGPGKVPVVIVNSSQLVRHIWLFEGGESVNLVPDYRTGKWILSRPPIIEFKIGPAKNSNWAEEKIFYYPRNAALVIYDQPERFWGSPVGQPFIMSGRTGANPMATSYWRQTPSGGTGVAGAVVQLPWVDAAGPANGLRLEFDINPGAAIKEGIGRALR